MNMSYTNPYSYNTDFLDLEYTLINTFLVEALPNLVDISYSVKNGELVIQVVLLQDSELEDEGIILSKLTKQLPDLKIAIYKLFVTKEEFNKDKRAWLPTSYKWLEYLLFSKGEIL